MFLETEAAFPYCNWSIQMARIIWFGSTSMDIGQAYIKQKKMAQIRLFSFLSLCENMKFFEPKTYSFVSIKKKKICQKFVHNNLVQIWFASALELSSEVSCSPSKM